MKLCVIDFSTQIILILNNANITKYLPYLVLYLQIVLQHELDEILKFAYVILQSHVCVNSIF